MAKVLVTGANGFLGSWLVRRLVEEGHQVFSLVRKSSDLSDLKDIKTEYVYGDVTNIHSLLDACKGMDSVFHLAGLIAYKKSERKRMEAINVGGTANVIEACRIHKVRRLVHLSSVVAVGAGFTPSQILNEQSEFNVESLHLGYFDTKRAAEKLVTTACQKKQIDAVILNPSTIYGPGDAKKGSRKTQLKVARGKFRFFTSGGVSIVAVQDAVDGIISAWKKGITGERYILSGDNITIKHLFELIAELASVPAPKTLMPSAVLHAIGFAGDLAHKVGLSSPVSQENAWTATMFHWFDNSKAKAELDFNPRPAKEAIAQSVQWMKDNGLLN
jgi:dihydroflavonol-4-reductase